MGSERKFWIVIVSLLTIVIIALARDPRSISGAGLSPTPDRSTTDQSVSGNPQSPSTALGSGFTYQGQLTQNGSPVTDQCDIAFRLYNAASGPAQIGNAITQTVVVTNGLFTTGLDFGVNAFDGNARWLDMQVSCPAGSGIFAPLAARQPLTAEPYAVYAIKSGTATTATYATSAGSAATANSVITVTRVLTPTMRKYYLTSSQKTGGQALTACAAGYHMASLWEIYSPSSLLYDTSLGAAYSDSGSGPPQDYGWIRTGAAFPGFNDHDAGQASCNVWTSSSTGVTGTLVGLMQFWDPVSPSVYHNYINPWQSTEQPCNYTYRVWCVQNLP